MKTESNIKPLENVVIELTSDGMCDVLLFANIPNEPEIIDGDDGITYERYKYDFYRFSHPYRIDLKSEIEKGLNGWIEYAKALEKQPKEMTDKEKILALEADNELLKGCIMEIADILFS